MNLQSGSVFLPAIRDAVPRFAGGVLLVAVNAAGYVFGYEQHDNRFALRQRNA